MLTAGPNPSIRTPFIFHCKRSELADLHPYGRADLHLRDRAGQHLFGPADLHLFGRVDLHFPARVALRLFDRVAWAWSYRNPAHIEESATPSATRPFLCWADGTCNTVCQSVFGEVGRHPYRPEKSGCHRQDEKAESYSSQKEALQSAVRAVLGLGLARNKHLGNQGVPKKKKCILESTGYQGFCAQTPW